MIEIILKQANLDVIKADGGKLLTFSTPNGITVVVPLSDEIARQLGQALTGSNIIVPNIVPPKSH